MRKFTICVDFDGTCVTHEYPNIGADVGAAPVLRKLVQMKCRLILFTMRSGSDLAAAVEWFAKNNIPLFGINENPEQHIWTSSPKPYANLYIDDAAYGVPLISRPGYRPYVDWQTIADEMSLDIKEPITGPL